MPGKNKNRKSKTKARRNPRAYAHELNPVAQNRTFDRRMADQIAKPNDLCNPRMKEIYKNMTTLTPVGPSRYLKPPSMLTNYGGTTVSTGYGAMKFFDADRAGQTISSRVTIPVPPLASGTLIATINLGFIGNQCASAMTWCEVTQANEDLFPNSWGNPATSAQFGSSPGGGGRAALIANDPFGAYTNGYDEHAFVLTRLSVRVVNQNDAVSSRSGNLWFGRVQSYNNYLASTELIGNSRAIHYNSLLLDDDDQPTIHFPVEPIVSAKYAATTGGINVNNGGDHLMIYGTDISGEVQFEIITAGYYVGRQTLPEKFFTFNTDDYECVITCLCRLWYKAPTTGTRSELIEDNRKDMEREGLMGMSGFNQWLATGLGVFAEKGLPWLFDTLLPAVF